MYIRLYKTPNKALSCFVLSCLSMPLPPPPPHPPGGRINGVCHLNNKVEGGSVGSALQFASRLPLVIQHFPSKDSHFLLIPRISLFVIKHIELYKHPLHAYALIMTGWKLFFMEICKIFRTETSNFIKNRKVPQVTSTFGISSLFISLVSGS